MADAKVWHNGEGAAGAKFVVNLDECGFIVAAQNFEVAILTVHPIADFWIALARADGDHG